METTFLATLALLPILLIPILIYVKKIPRFYAILAGCLFAGVMAMLFWRVSVNQVFATFVQGLWKGAMVILALYSALLFVAILQKTGAPLSMSKGFAEITPDRRIQMIIVAWFLASGLENIFGFGLACGMCSLILMRIGFPPACAAMASLIGPITAASFSMVGLPVLYSIPEGLAPKDFVRQSFTSGVSMENYLKFIMNQAVILNSIAGTFIPLFMIMMMTRFYGRRKSWTTGMSIAPFAIFCGLAFTIPFALTTIYISSEFSAITAAAIGLAMTMIAIRFHFLIPQRDVWDFKNVEQWEVDWSAGKIAVEPPSTMPAWMAWLPIGLLTIFILSGRLSPFSNFLKSYSFIWDHIFGSNVSIVAHPLYQPCSGAFFATSVLLIVMYRLAPRSIVEAFLTTGPFTWGALNNWLLVMPLVNIYIYSDVNSSGLPSMLDAIMGEIARIPGGGFLGVFLAPFAGAMGSFFAQSNTLSNMALAAAQFNFAQNLELPTSLFLALQIAGAGAGNMLTFPYLANAGWTVGMLGWESPFLRKVIFPVMWYVSILGTLGIISLYFWENIRTLF